MQETWVQLPGSGRSPGVGNRNSLWYSFLGRRAWQSMDDKRVGHDLATKQQYMNLMVTTNKYFSINPHIKKEEESKHRLKDSHQITKEKNKRRKKQQNYKMSKYIKVAIVSTSLSINTLKVNGINFLIKRHKSG